MDPERYYKYSDLKTIDGRTAVHAAAHADEAVSVEQLSAELAAHASAAEDGADPDVVYMLSRLGELRPGAVLAVGFGTPLRNAVRAADNAGVRPLFTTGTDDKLRPFSFAGTATVASLGPRFDERLFTNECAVLRAAKDVEARTVLWVNRQEPSALMRREAARANMLLLTPQPVGRGMDLWSFAPPDEADAAALAAGTLPEPDWRRCAHCGLAHDAQAVRAAGWECPSCGRLMRMDSDERLAETVDAGSFAEMDAHLPERDPLAFPDFDAIIERARTRSGHDEGVRCGTARICGIPVAVGVMEPAFMMGSMGSVVGEKLTRMIERATADGLPVIIFSASGGARMQEGLASLMQMAKVSAALEAHARAGGLYISVLTDPTTGGVTASFATLGDVIVAEPQALIGFAGRRVIQDTIKQTLPDDFQSAEFALEHGLIDAIVPRAQMRATLARLLSLHGCEPAAEYAESATAGGAAAGDEPAAAAAATNQADEASGTDDGTPAQPQSPRPLRGIMGGLASLADSLGQAVSEQTSAAGLWWALRNQRVADAPGMKPMKGKPSALAGGADAPENHAWESVQLARNAKRPTSLYYIQAMFDDFTELHGDRAFADDGAIVAGLGRIDGRAVTVIAQEKGADLKSRIARNFGCPQPEGYRKAQRLMRQAEKFGRPIVCIVDTQGAFCGKEAEERGMGNAISESLALMAGLTVPVVTVVIGEGGSGGALALAVANRIGMQENAVYSVLSPEGFASILWKDGSRAPEAAQVMKMSAADALELGVVEDVIPEGRGPAHENPAEAAAAVWLFITNALQELDGKTPDELRAERYDRFRAF